MNRNFRKNTTFSNYNDILISTYYLSFSEKYFMFPLKSLFATFILLVMQYG